MSDTKYVFKTEYGVSVNGAIEDVHGLIEDEGVDMILTDLPYGKTKNKGDVVIPPDVIWPIVNRITKKNSAIILFGQGDFSAMMIMSNKKDYRYTLIYEKTMATGHLNAKRMPMRCHEDMMVFYKALPVYNPQKTKGHKRKVSTAHHKRNSKKTTNYGKFENKGYDSTERYPRSVWKYKTDKQKNPRHPQQKPIKLLEDLIKTYSNPGDTIADLTSGSGSTAIAAINTGRKFIVVEKERDVWMDGIEWIKEIIN